VSPTKPATPDGFESFAEYFADVLCRVSLDSSIIFASPSCMSLLGYTQEEMVGKLPPELVPPEDLPIVLQAFQNVLRPDFVSHFVTARIIRKDGSHVWVESIARIIRDPDTDQPVEFVMVWRDITERKQLEQQLEALAMTDSLTGLLNRRAFDAAFDHEWGRVLRDASETSLLLLDIDHFKKMNDTYGHTTGDDCLRIIARTLTLAIHRPTDIVARYGGEEFAVILPRTELTGAMIVAERIRQEIEELRIPHAGNREGGGFVTVSIGTATALARHGSSYKMPDSLLMAADTALYKAKFEGRNRIATGMLVASPGQRK
jgi:diguanylate cyclase (GGDEF)-like protein/PAS domain S-box-containing protein